MLPFDEEVLFDEGAVFDEEVAVDEEVVFKFGVVEVEVEVVVVVVVGVVVVVVVVLVVDGVVTAVDGPAACVVHWLSNFKLQLFEAEFHWKGKSQVMHYPLTSYVELGHSQADFCEFH